MKRYGMVINVKKDKVEEYKKLHAAVWPDVLKKIKDCNIINYSIYLAQLKKGKYTLFSYFEYTGQDFDADMKKMADDPVTQKWWDVCISCLNPIELRQEGELWMNMEELFYVE